MKAKTPKYVQNYLERTHSSRKEILYRFLIGELPIEVIEHDHNISELEERVLFFFLIHYCSKGLDVPINLEIAP